MRECEGLGWVVILHSSLIASTLTEHPAREQGDRMDYIILGCWGGHHFLSPLPSEKKLASQ